MGMLSVILQVAALWTGVASGMSLPSILNRSQGSTSSCRERCFEVTPSAADACSCDALCIAYNTCCHDFNELCIQPGYAWNCVKSRCGETRTNETYCNCADDCLEHRDCCTNYNVVCKGEKHWVDDQCDDTAEPECPPGFSKPPLILVSLDGYKADYLNFDKTIIPVVQKLRTCGTSARHLRPMYPTKTFPNHYSMVTGLYPESHGIIDNVIYDSEFNATFTYRGKEKLKHRWWGGQPIWITVEKQDKKSSTFFWPSGINHDLRLFTILRWLDLPPAERPIVYGLYVEQPDLNGHLYGPNSFKVKNILVYVDELVGKLMDGLKQRNLHKCVDIMFVSDHGMADVSRSRVEFLSSYLTNVDNFELVHGSSARIHPNANAAAAGHQPFDQKAVMANLTCRRPDQHFRPYLKQHLPKRLHYAFNRRIEDIHLFVDERWLVDKKESGDKDYFSGEHGYDNRYESMQAVFIGYGPSFKYKTEVDPVENIELYNLMCDLLGVMPMPNNGTHGSLNHLLRRPVHRPALPEEVSKPASCPATGAADEDPQCECDPGSYPADSLNRQLLNSVPQDNHHLPFGRPRVLLDTRYCLLHHTGFESAYSEDYRMPLWTSFTLPKSININEPSAALAQCLKPDIRIPVSKVTACKAFKSTSNLSYGYLYPPSLSRSESSMHEGLLASNIVPMYKPFKRIWKHFHDVLLKTYGNQHHGINVVSGPVFDYNADGRFDPVDKILQHTDASLLMPVPSHYFIVITSCRDEAKGPNQCEGKLEASSFILPHRPGNEESCNSDEEESRWVEELVKMHAARVRDVELLSGLDFFHQTNFAVNEIMALKTSLPTFTL